MSHGKTCFHQDNTPFFIISEYIDLIMCYSDVAALFFSACILHVPMESKQDYATWIFPQTFMEIL